MGAASGKPPYYGQWGLKTGAASGQAGPYDTQEDAFAAGIKAVKDAGAQRLPDDGFVKVVDSVGATVGPTTG
jgi:hypothetical protein